MLNRGRQDHGCARVRQHGAPDRRSAPWGLAAARSTQLASALAVGLLAACSASKDAPSSAGCEGASGACRAAGDSQASAEASAAGAGEPVRAAAVGGSAGKPSMAAPDADAGPPRAVPAGRGGTPQPMAAGSDAGEPDAAPPDTGTAQTSPTCGLCDAYAEPTTLATLDVPALDALSGLATSRSQPHVLYAHNDHDRPTVYALTEQGRLLVELELTGARATDIEDISVGACPEGSCIHLADIGDNAAIRTSYAVLRFAEPELPAQPSSDPLQIVAERFEFIYEDGSHNAEGMFVAPDGHAIYVVTKPTSGPASVYRIAEPSTAGMNVAVKAAQLPIPAASDMETSAAAAHPCGLGFLVRTYDRVYEFRSAPGMPFESALQAMPTIAAMPAEMQSEGIDYLPDGRGFVSSGEGAAAPILITRCR